MASLVGQSFIGKVSKFASGTVLAQFIPILLSPVLARMYAPEAFGTVAAVTALVGFFSAVSCFRYEAAICLPKYKIQAYYLVQTCLWAMLVFMALVSLLYLFLSDSSLWHSIAPVDKKYVAVVGFLIVAGAVIRAHQMVNIREEKFFSAGIGSAYGTAFTGVSQILGGLVSATAPVLVFGRTLGAAVTAGFLVYTGRSSLSKPTRKQTVKEQMSAVLAIARRYKDLPIHSALPAFANSVASNFPLIIIGSAYGVTALGYFAMIQRLILMPGRLVGESLRNVFLQTSAKQYASGESIHRQFRQVAAALLTVSIVFSLLVFFFADSIFVIVLGDQWGELGAYAKILIIPFAIRFTASSLSNVFIVVRKTKSLAYFQYAFMACRIGTLWVASIYFDLIHFFICLAVVDTIFYTIYFCLGWKVSKLTKS